MNRQNNQHEVIVSGLHIELTPALKTFVSDKAQRLFRHQERIIRIRVELDCDGKSVSNRFIAKGHINIYGPDLNAMVSSDDCYKAISLLIDKLDGMLRKRAQLTKAKRNHPRPVELAAALPKTE